jgi:hypothetical protein
VTCDENHQSAIQAVKSQPKIWKADVQSKKKFEYSQEDKAPFCSPFHWSKYHNFVLFFASKSDFFAL